MSIQTSRAVAFDVEPVALASLRQALPDWEIAAIDGATPESLAHHWNPERRSFWSWAPQLAQQ